MEAKKNSFVHLYSYLLRAMPVSYSSLNDCDSNVNEYTAYIVVAVRSYQACYSDFHFVSIFFSLSLFFLVQFIVSLLLVWIRAHFRMGTKMYLFFYIRGFFLLFCYDSIFFLLLLLHLCFSLFVSVVLFLWLQNNETQLRSSNVLVCLFSMNYSMVDIYDNVPNISTAMSMELKMNIIYFHSE